MQTLFQVNNATRNPSCMSSRRKCTHFRFPLPAFLRSRRNPAVLLYLCGTGIAIALRTQSGQQARRQGCPCSWQRLKNEKIGMLFRGRGDLAVQCRDSFPYLRSSGAITCTTVCFASITARSPIAGLAWLIPCIRHAVSSPCRPRRWRKNFFPSIHGTFCNSSNHGQRSKKSHTRWLSNFANHSRTCGKYTFNYPLRRFSCAVFSSTSLRRSSTRFCTRRVASYPASNVVVGPGAAPAVPAANPHPAGHPWRPTDTTLRACSPTWSMAPDTDAGIHTCATWRPAPPSPAPPPPRSDHTRIVDTVPHPGLDCCRPVLQFSGFTLPRIRFL